MIDEPLEFELTIRLALGRKAYHIAGESAFPKARRQWLRRVIRKMRTNVLDLDTNEWHKESLCQELERLENHIRGLESPSWPIINTLFRISLRLIGYHFLQGKIAVTPTYHQNHCQYYVNRQRQGGAAFEQFDDRKSIIAWRVRIAHSLREKGISTFRIALVLNLSEYQVKRLLKIPPTPTPQGKG